VLTFSFDFLKQTGQKERERIKLSNTREPVASIVDGEKLDFRIWVDSNNYQGRTKQGLRFYLFDGMWREFRKLIGRVDKAYEDRVA
jgi:hypothetical protein